MSRKIATVTTVLLSLAASSAMAAPVYDIDNYGLILQEGEKADVTPYFQANINYGKISSVEWRGSKPLGDWNDSASERKSGYDLQLGLNNQLGGGYSIDTALYFTSLGKAKWSYGSFVTTTETDPDTGDVTEIVSEQGEGDSSLPIRGYGLKVAFGFPTTTNSTTSLIVGAGFMQSNMKLTDSNGVSSTEKVEGGQVSVGIGYRYKFNKSISWNINAENYILASGSTAKTDWLGVSSGLRFNFK